MVPKQEGIHMILFVPNKIFSRSEEKIFTKKQSKKYSDMLNMKALVGIRIIFYG